MATVRAKVNICYLAVIGFERSSSETNIEGQKQPIDTPKIKEFAPIAVAYYLSFSPNQLAETLAQAFNRNG